MKHNKYISDMQQAYDQVIESYGSSGQHTQGVDPSVDNDDVTSIESTFDPVQANRQADIPQLQQLRDNAHATISYLTQVVDNYIAGEEYVGDSTLEEDLGIARNFLETACGCRSRKH